MTDHPTALDLINQASLASTSEELDRIEAEANGRSTVLDAVHKRRNELLTEQSQQTDTQQSQQTGSMTSEERTGPSAESMPEHMTEYTPEQVDPPQGPYPDPPKGPYPDPVEKEHQEQEYDPDRHPGS